MKKAISIFAMVVCLIAFAPAEQPKEFSVKLTIEEANAVIQALQNSDNISAKQSALIVSKINAAYTLAVKDSTKDSSKNKKP